MSTARTLLAGTLATTLLAAGITTATVAHSAPNNDDNPTTAHTYTAIGDSATVAGSWSGTAGNNCGHNRLDYPHQTASRTGLNLNEGACYNATTRNYIRTMPAGVLSTPNPAQRDAIDHNTRLITIQLGLGDIMGTGPNNLLLRCMASGKPVEVTGRPCQDKYGHTTNAAFQGLTTRLTAIYRNAHATAPPQHPRHSGRLHAPLQRTQHLLGSPRHPRPRLV